MNSPLEVQLSVENLFRIAAFRRSTHEIEDDGATFSLVLEPGDTPLYVRKYPLTKTHKNSASLLLELETSAKRFVDKGITPALKSSPNYSLESGRTEALDYQQVVALVGKNQWWIARLIGKIHHEFYYLLHWVGNQPDAEKIVSSIASFELIQPVAGQHARD